jgi:putative transposase
MARIARVVIPNLPHHVTQRGVRSMNIFFKDDDYEYYKKVLHEQAQVYDLEIISYCLMTNHVHLIVIPKTKESLSKVIGETHRLYTRKINFEQKVKGHLFQSRFYSTPLDETHLLNAIKYVELNPVKARIVKFAWDYMYSSVLHRLDCVNDEILSYHEVFDNIKNYKNFLLEQEEYKNLEEKTRTGKPCGDLAFYEKIKELTGIDYLPKKRGPKSKENKS